MVSAIDEAEAAAPGFGLGLGFVGSGCFFMMAGLVCGGSGRLWVEVGGLVSGLVGAWGGWARPAHAAVAKLAGTKSAMPCVLSACVPVPIDPAHLSPPQPTDTPKLTQRRTQDGPAGLPGRGAAAAPARSAPRLLRSSTTVGFVGYASSSWRGGGLGRGGGLPHLRGFRGDGRAGYDSKNVLRLFVCLRSFTIKPVNPSTTGGGAAALPSSSSSSAAAMALKLAADLLDRDQPGLLEGALEVRNDETN